LLLTAQCGGSPTLLVAFLLVVFLLLLMMMMTCQPDILNECRYLLLAQKPLIPLAYSYTASETNSCDALAPFGKGVDAFVGDLHTTV
jgi:hypothetical protein